MTSSGEVTAQVWAAARDACLDLAWSIPLVLGGILLTGSLYYALAIAPHASENGFRAWARYLFPPENYRTRSARIDLWVWVINGLLVIPIFAACVAVSALFAGVGFADLLREGFGPIPGLHSPLWLAILIQFLGNYFGFGAGQYFGHLAFHKVPALWALHRAHHSAETANPLTFLRSHPAEVFLNGATRVIGAAVGLGATVYLTGGALLPATITLIFWYNILYVIVGFRSLDHTHIPLSYGKVLDVFVGSPVLHQVHHSAELRHRDVNMAGAGYIYDWLFGTYYRPNKGETWRWGLNEDELGDSNPHNSVRAFFVEPLIAMWRELRRQTVRRDRT